MTFLTDTSLGHAPIGGCFRSVGGAVSNGFRAYVESRSRNAQVERLNAMSDAQLAKMNLKREDIVRHVFSDLFGF